MSKVTDKVKKAIVTACMSEGYESVIDILAISAMAMRSVGEMSVAGYKAGFTRKHRRYKRK